MRPGDSNEITREYIDSILLKMKLIDSDLPSTEMKLFGKTFATPVMTAALSHLHKTRENGMVEAAIGAKEAGAVYWCGMGSREELSAICETGAEVIKIIKPMANEKDVYGEIEHAKKCGVLAMGMDIDHAYNKNGGYDEIEGIKMRPKTAAQLAEYVKAAERPFIIKGVLSVEDALKCAEIGVSGIVVSHHHGTMDFAVPPLMILPDIVEAVGGKMKIFVDCHMDTGMDVFKAMALGADGASLGRAIMEPLREKGAEGVKEYIEEATRKLKTVMARTGYHSLEEIDDSCIYRR